MKLLTLLSVVVVCACYISTGQGRKYLLETEDDEAGDYEGTMEMKERGNPRNRVPQRKLPQGGTHSELL